MALPPDRFIVRVQTKKGVQRMYFPDANATLQDLRLQVQDVCGIPIESQLLSRTHLKTPTLLPGSGKEKLAELNIKRGDMLYLGDTREPEKESLTPAPGPLDIRSPRTPSLTSRCQHPPNGACPHCRPSPMTGERSTPRCQHGPGTTCINCLKTPSGGSPAPWLCLHPDTAFCPKCLPPETPEAKKIKRCNCGPGQKCSSCVETAPAMKVDLRPVAQIIKERKAACLSVRRHKPEITCPFCAPPPVPSYTGNKNCAKGHLPWPAGVCMNCAIPLVHIRSQNYRHCDTVSVPSEVVQHFYLQWARKGLDKPRAAIMFGNYVDEPPESKLEGGVRALVHALYEPPQDVTSAGLRFLRDPEEKNVHAIAEELGMEPVGWVIATLPRSGDKYGGKVFLSGTEIQQAARFQQRYRSEQGYSRFVTMIIEHGEQVEPAAYQVSDQCVALERDGWLTRGADPNMLMIRKVEDEKKEMKLTAMYKNQALDPGVEFVPDEFLVKVIVATGKPGAAKFPHWTFPSRATDSDVRTHMATFAREDYVRRLNDFNLLCFLAKTIGMPLVKQVLAAIKAKRSLTKQESEALDRAMMEKNLLF